MPKDAYDITILTKTIGICTEKGIVVADPTKWVVLPFFLRISANLTYNCSFTSGNFTLVPDFTKANETSALKAKCEAARPLGMARCDATSELLVIYDGV